MKKKLWRSALSLLLALALLCALLPQTATVARADDPVYSGRCGDNLTWTFDPDTGALTIEGSGEMWDYLTEIYLPWYNFRNLISSASLPTGLQKIVRCAFFNCTNLTEVAIPSSLTAIDSRAFFGCVNLTNVVFPEGLTSIGDSAFSGCAGLASIVFPDVTSIGASAFSDCTGLTSVVFQDGNYFNAYAFSGCTGLTSVVLPSLITISRYAFSGCTGLNSVTIPESVIYISEGAFSGCTGLTSITFPESVTSIQSAAFSGCSSLTSVTIPANVNIIGYNAFNGCTALTELTNYSFSCQISDNRYTLGIPGQTTLYGYAKSTTETYASQYGYPFVSLGSLTLSGSCGANGDNLTWTLDTETGLLAISGSGEMKNYTYYAPPPWYDYRVAIKNASLPSGLTNLGACAFHNCSNLTTVEIPNGATTIGDSAFKGCSSLTTVTIPDSVGAIGEYAFYECDKLTAVAIPEGVTSIGQSTFSSCGDLRTVSLPDSLTSIGTSAFSGCAKLDALSIPGNVNNIGAAAFYDCVNLNSVTIPSGVQVLKGEVFSGCSGLNSVTFSESLSEIGREAFWGCKSLTSLELPSGLTTICEGAFRDCSGLTSVTIPDSVTTIEAYAFAYCKNVPSVTIPDGVTSIQEGVFRGCTGLTSVTLSDSITSIGSFAFYKCAELTAIALPSHVTVIGAFAFSECAGLTSVTFPEGLTRIDGDAFSKCTGLTSVTIPGSVRTIGDSAFYNCTNVTELMFSEGVTTIGDWAFKNCAGVTSVVLPSSLSSIGYDAFHISALTSVTVYSYHLRFTSDGYTESDPSILRNVFGIPGQTTIYGYGNSDMERYAQLCGYTFVPLSYDAFSGPCGAEGDNLIWTYDPETTTLTITGSGEMKEYDTLNVPWCHYTDEMTKISLPEGITYICARAFYACTEVETVTLPESLERMGSDVFRGCEKLRALVFRNPDCLICTQLVYVNDNEGLETGEDLQYLEYPETLGNPDQVGLYGIHDPERENAPVTIVNTVDPADSLIHYTYTYRKPENCAKVLGYAYYATGTFSDVGEGKWYEIPVAWAYGKGITSGTGNGKFSPNATCTREQIATFIWKAYDSPEAGGTVNPFTDVNPEKYYAPAVLWAYYHEPQITGGMNAETFGVGKPCTRAQVVTFLYAAAGKPEPTTTENPFTDVKETDYFYKAVLWAVENGITSGVSPTSFAPKQTCTRAQVVTFLYKAVG